MIYTYIYIIPIGSMYAIYIYILGNIYHQYTPHAIGNVSIPYMDPMGYIKAIYIYKIYIIGKIYIIYKHGIQNLKEWLSITYCSARITVIANNF